MVSTRSVRSSKCGSRRLRDPLALSGIPKVGATRHGFAPGRRAIRRFSRGHRVASGRASRRPNRSRRRAARNRMLTPQATRSPSAGVISPRAMPVRTIGSNCRESSTERSDDRSIPSRAAGSGAVSRGGQSCSTSGAADGACDRAERGAFPGSPAARPDRARAARDWGCRAAGHPGCRSFPSQTVRAHPAREPRRNLDQAVEVPRFGILGAAENSAAQADRQRSRA